MRVGECGVAFAGLGEGQGVAFALVPGKRRDFPLSWLLSSLAESADVALLELVVDRRPDFVLHLQRFRYLSMTILNVSYLSYLPVMRVTASQVARPSHQRSALTLHEWKEISDRQIPFPRSVHPLPS